MSVEFIVREERPTWKTTGIRLLILLPVVFILYMIFSLFFIFARLTDPSVPDAPASVVKIGERHTFKGLIGATMLDLVRDLTAKGELKEAEFMSGGGSIGVAREIGLILRDHDVIISQSSVGRCYSACLDILSLADMRRARIDDNAYFMFHGGRLTMDETDYYLFEYPIQLMARHLFQDVRQEAQPSYSIDKLQPGLMSYFFTCKHNPLFDIDPLFLSWGEIKQIGAGTFTLTCDQAMARPAPYWPPS
ncbi:hypothetical protein ACFSM5_10430 [Lacibacterium aquatile]|uniref:PBP domain-containing protein n=1 Tax=Lacibacterium aquatile TaxID=1168082 RepID=A0ABW5DSC3_9PROT